MRADAQLPILGVLNEAAMPLSLSIHFIAAKEFTGRVALDHLILRSNRAKPEAWETAEDE